MAFYNHLVLERRDWSGMVFNSLPPGSGVLFEEVTLDKRIGSEVVALLIEPEPDELLEQSSLTLKLRGGLAATAHGPVLFLIWWIPPIINGHPFSFYEQVMNPLYSKTSEVLRRVANQTHLMCSLLMQRAESATYSNTRTRLALTKSSQAWMERVSHGQGLKTFN